MAVNSNSDKVIYDKVAHFKFWRWEERKKKETNNKKYNINKKKYRKKKREFFGKKILEDIGIIYSQLSHFTKDPPFAFFKFSITFEPNIIRL